MDFIKINAGSPSLLIIKALGEMGKGRATVIEIGRKLRKNVIVMEAKKIKYYTNVQESLLPNLTLRNSRIIKSSFHVPHRLEGVLEVLGWDEMLGILWFINHIILWFYIFILWVCW